MTWLAHMWTPGARIPINMRKFVHILSLPIPAICKPLSVLSYKKERVIIKLIIIWSLSIIISLPETMMLSAVSFLNNRLHFPCAEEDIFWDLSSCDPSWSNSTVFLITSLKTVMLFIVPLVIMVIIYRQIFKTLWSRKMTG